MASIPSSRLCGISHERARSRRQADTLARREKSRLASSIHQVKHWQHAQSTGVYVSGLCSAPSLLFLRTRFERQPVTRRDAVSTYALAPPLLKRLVRR